MCKYVSTAVLIDEIVLGDLSRRLHSHIFLLTEQEYFQSRCVTAKETGTLID